MLFKACQYFTNDDKVFMGLKQVSVKDAQSRIQKIITWTKKSKKERQEWRKLVFKAGCCLASSRHLSKQDLQAKSLCLKNVLNSKKPYFFVMVGRRHWHYNSEFMMPKFGLLQRQLLFA